MFKLYSITVTVKKSLLKAIVTYNRKYSPQLMEIGKIETPKFDAYQAGQLFIHKFFGYRGLIVLPWTGQIFDRDIQENPGHSDYKIVRIDERDVKFYTKNYYQVLTDSRDHPYVNNLTEVSTGLAGTPNYYSKLLHFVPGLDYAAHEDILPYTSTEQVPFNHEMFNELFYHRPGNYIEPREMIQSILMKSTALRKIDVHKETTEKVKIVAIPTYLGCKTMGRMGSINMYSWRYTVRIENSTGSSLRLLSQKWRVYNLKGRMEEVCVEGVMGEEVTIDHNLPVFQYNSNVNLLTPSGHMTGTFNMEKQDFKKLSCRIPKIFLHSRRGLNEVSC